MTTATASMRDNFDQLDVDEVDPVSLEHAYSALQNQDSPKRSYFGRCIDTILRRKSSTAKVASVSQTLPTSQTSTNSSLCGRCIRWPFEKMHSPIGSSVITAASLVGFVASNTVFPSAPLSLASSIAFGYFGQTVASHCAKIPTTTMKQGSLSIKRVQQHTSLASMMLAGYYQKQAWASILNCILAGMSVRIKVKNHGEFPVVQGRVDPSILEPPAETSERARAIQEKLPLILGIISTLTCVAGLGAMFAFTELANPRKLTLGIAAAEYGVKGLGIVLGFKMERLLDKYKTNPTCANIQNALSLAENIGIGLAVYAHRYLLTNISAFSVVFPIGFFLGTNISRMHRLSQIEDQIVDSSTLDPGLPRFTLPSVVAHLVMSALFEAAGVGFLLYGNEDTVGLEVFFLLTPPIYYITRFGFSQKQAHNSGFQKIGHFLMHKSTLVLSTELNYGLSFVFAHAVLPTDQNARIFYVFQALLFGSTQGALFAIDKEEDLSFSVQGAKRQLLRKIRVSNTSNYARIDILITSLTQTFKKLQK
jgi:hypothetical protein